MKAITGTCKYVEAMRNGGLPAAYGQLSKPRRRYAHDLVEQLGWSVRTALQHAWEFPYDEWLYDCRANSPVHVHVSRRSGKIGKRYEND